MTRSFRLQITAWYALFFSLLLGVFSLVLYSGISRSLERRLDDTLTTEMRTAVALFQSEMREMNGNAPVAAAEAVEEMRTEGVQIAIYAGETLLAAQQPWVLTVPRAEGEARWKLQAAGRTWRIAGARLSILGAAYQVVAASPADAVAAEMAAVRQVLAVALPLFLLLGGLGGYLIASRSVRPLAEMAAQAREMGARTLQKRLAVSASAEELTTLAETFNALLARLDTSFESMRRFIADASHEMRTPLAVIRGEADVALSRERTPAEYQTALTAIQDEAKRLARLVEDLLNLARADAGHARLQLNDFYLNDLLADCCRTVQTLAAARGVSVECRGGEDTPWRADEELLRRAILNLLDNAIRYTPAGGTVTASLALSEAEAQVAVRDTGQGIAAEALPHLFERFYRAESARSRKDGGFGLGLAIVEWITEAHHGRVSVESQVGQGSCFTITLPR